MTARIFLSGLLGMVGLWSADLAWATEVSITGDRFVVDGRPTSLWGIRVASAAQSEALTSALVVELDDYRRHGINAVTVFYQGSNGACSDPFTADGAEIEPALAARMDRIIRACDERGLVVIVGIFYQLKPVAGVAPVVRLRDWAACLRAVGTVARTLRPHRNVIVNIANEQNSAGHASHPWAPVRTPEAIIAACRVVHAEDPRRLVGGGGYDHDHNLQIGRSPEVDVLLFDTLGPDRQASSGHWYDHFTTRGVTGKPIVNVEMFGNWTGQFRPPGVYPDAAKRIHYQEIDDARARPGLSVFFHSNNWCQGGYDGWPNRYELGGNGSAESPGIRWYFNYLRRGE